MRHVLRFGLLSICLCLMFAPAKANEPEAKPVAEKPAAESEPSKPDFPESVRVYIATKYFDGCESSDPRIDTSVKLLLTPDSILEHIRQNEWEAGQLEDFALNKLHLILTTPTGELRSLVFRDGKKRSDRKLTPERARVLQRLYSEEVFAAQEDKPLAEARLRKRLQPADVLEAAIRRLDDKHKLDDDTLTRARANILAAADEGNQLALALTAFDKAENAPANRWAGIWLISRLDAMCFWRENDEGSIDDLEAIDARTFYENVFYATKARLEFPWGRECSDNDFLQQVLSPRGTGEPLQRWRKHFYSALQPELAEMEPSDAAKAVALAGDATYDFFQYYGDTTWEDFGMLTALAVHEGRCEDCSNVENCMLRAAGFPAAQAFTPWWGRGNGNHAWTVIPSLDGGKNGNGGKAVKVYLKTWDKLEDITAVNTEVIHLPIELDKGVSAEKAELKVWNADEWRLVARSLIKENRVEFENVGARLPFVLLVSAEGSSDRLLTIVEQKVTLLNNSPEATPSEQVFNLEFEKACDLGEFEPDQDYVLYMHTAEGWQEVEHERPSTGGLNFQCEPLRLYRIDGAGINGRPFTAKPGVEAPALTRY